MAMPRSRGVTSAPRSAGPGFTPYERLRDMSLRRSAREGTKGADGLPVMNSASLRAAAIEHDGYETPELNDRLYLHFKGFKKIENLEPYTGLKALWLESNGIGTIENLDHLSELRCLFLQQNTIREIGSGLRSLTALQTLNLAHNHIRHVDNLDTLPQLATLNLSHNAISEPSDLAHLAGCSALTNLDLSSNNLESPQLLEPVLRSMSNLVALKLKGNPMVKHTRHYRKTVITWLPNLRHLDDRPIFDDERGATEAWARGGRQAEKEWRLTHREREQAKHREQRERFRQWQADVRERRAKELAEYRAQVGDETAELPRKKWVQYGTVSKEQLGKLDEARRAVLLAELEAERIAKNGTTVVEVGQRYFEARGASEAEDDGAGDGEGAGAHEGGAASAGAASAPTAKKGSDNAGAAARTTEDAPGVDGAGDGVVVEELADNVDPPAGSEPAVDGARGAPGVEPPVGEPAVVPASMPATTGDSGADSGEPGDEEEARGQADGDEYDNSEAAKAEREWRVQESLRIYRARLKEKRASEKEKAQGVSSQAAPGTFSRLLTSAQASVAKSVQPVAMPPPPALWFAKLDKALTKALKLAKFDFKKTARAVSVAVEKGLVKLPADHPQTRADVVKSLTAAACRQRVAYLKKQKDAKKKASSRASKSVQPPVTGAAAAIAAAEATPAVPGDDGTKVVNGVSFIPVDRLLKGSFDAPLPMRDIRPVAPLPSMEADSDEEVEGPASVAPARPLTRAEIVSSILTARGGSSSMPAGASEEAPPASEHGVSAGAGGGAGAGAAATDVDAMD